MSKLYYRQKNYGEIFPDWYLVQATKDGLALVKDQWALVRRNDPDFAFIDTPYPEPKQDDSDASYLAWAELANGCLQCFNDNPAFLYYRLVSVAKQFAEYDPSEHPVFEMWLFDYVGKYITNHSNPIY